MANPVQGATLRSVGVDQVLAIVAALIIAGASGWVGIQARNASAALATKRVALQQLNEQFASTKRQFRGPTTTDHPDSVRCSSRAMVRLWMRTPAARNRSVSTSASRPTPPSSPANTGDPAVEACADASAEACATVVSDTPRRTDSNTWSSSAASRALVVQEAPQLP